MSGTFLEKVVAVFSRTARSQELKGIEKYGHELQPMDRKWDWLEMAQEELVDGFKYLVAERERRDELIGEVESRIKAAMHFSMDTVVRELLTEVLGELKKLKGVEK